jgi:uncharacterized damage-inducible protein DinB
VLNAVDGLNAEQASWKPNDGENSIWETLEHLRFYNYAYAERFKGIDYKYPTDDNDETFSGGGSDEEWHASIGRFTSVMNEFRSLISSSQESKFAEAVSESNQASWGKLILMISAHNAYHAGQIILTRKLQGSWNPEKGVS